MKIAVLHGPGDLRLEQQPDPGDPGPNEILVRTIVTAFKIGTDRGNYEGSEQVPGAPDYPAGSGTATSAP